MVDIPSDQSDLPTVLVSKDTKETNDEAEFFGLVAVVKERFSNAETARSTVEQRWLKAYRNYRGIYGPDMVWRSDEQSKVFVKITKTKVLAAYGQLIEVVFSGNKFPIGVEPTRVPEGTPEFVHTDSNKAPPGISEALAKAEEIGFPGDNKEKPNLGPFDDLQKVDFFEGPAVLGPAQLQLKPAEKAAKNLEKVIHDQLEGSNANNVLRHALFEMTLFGTGIIKGPFNAHKTLNNWEIEDGKRVYKPIDKLIPRIEAVSLWNFYPDPEALVIDDAEWVIERHKLTASKLRGLMKRPYFRKDSIRRCLMRGPDSVDRSFEGHLADTNSQGVTLNRYEVLEYWGIMDKRLAEEANLDLPDDIDDLDEVQVNVWICQNEILRLVLNPFTPERLPYSVCPYEINPYSFWGIGVAENMDDSQQIMNGHARMAIDNLALAGNLVFDIDEGALVPGQDMRIYAGKIFRRQTGVPGQAVFGIKFPNTAPENMQMFDRFRQLADEQTGIPSFSHGQTGVQSMTRTAAGMSMLLGAAALNIKTVVKNLDHYLLQPLGEAFFAWNMQFNDDEELEIKGDLEIKARGTTALMQKEVRSQRLLAFMQVAAANPLLTPLVKWHVLLKDVADTMELEPEKIINDPEEAQIYAKLIGMMNNAPKDGSPVGAAGQQQGFVGGINRLPGSGLTANPTNFGNGNIGPGNISQPGENSFTA